MLIKRTARSRRRIRFHDRRVIVGLIGVAVATGLCLGSVYHGMVLVKSGRSMELSDWLGGLARTRLGVVPNYLSSFGATPERLEIDINFENLRRLAYTRERALKEGLLFATPEDWVPARIRHRGETYRVELRLKGDLSDHWRRPDTWSYKVKVRRDAALLGMKRFALQDPRTRKFMNEWVIQRLQRELGLIALRYEFVELTINGESQPIYALEENFEKRLIENNERREGPILRYDQWFYWKHDPGLVPTLAGAAVTAYQEDDLVADGLGPALARARSLLELFRRDELTASQVFDAEQMGRFFALIELIGYDHATDIDNLKFYYNPVTSRLEPIGYDFNHIKPLERDTELVVSRVLPRAVTDDPELRSKRLLDDWRIGLFADSAFLKSYVAALGQLTDPHFLDGFFAKIADDFDNALRILHRSDPWYEFDGRAILEQNQDYLRAFLEPEKAVQAYLVAPDDDAHSVTLQICNLHTLHVDVLGLELPDGGRLVPTRPARIPGHDQDDPLRYTTVAFARPDGTVPDDLASEGLRLRTRLFGTARQRFEEVHPWHPLELDLRQRPEASRLERFPFLAVDEERAEIRILPGSWRLEETLVLPPDHVVLAGAGCELDLVQGAALISYSPLSWAGTAEAPVRLGSSDATGQGLLVLAGGRPSRLSWVEFTDLNALAQSGWNQTGAVTFYESPADLVDCRFADGRSEDSLNTVRSPFELVRCSFVASYSDAFDADFCRGSLTDTEFLGCGNDAIDVSGSVVEAANIRIDGCGDKGISVGEASRVELQGIRIRAAEIALAGKDRSQVEAREIEIVDCRVGFAVFGKKSEFGPAHVRVTGLALERAERPHLLEEGSTLVIDGRSIEPVEGKVEDLLYGAEYGKASRP